MADIFHKLCSPCPSVPSTRYFSAVWSTHARRQVARACAVATDITSLLPCLLQSESLSKTTCKSAATKVIYHSVRRLELLVGEWFCQAEMNGLLLWGIRLYISCSQTSYQYWNTDCGQVASEFMCVQEQPHDRSPRGLVSATDLVPYY
jgi:hypothetical protein